MKTLCVLCRSCLHRPKALARSLAAQPWRIVPNLSLRQTNWCKQPVDILKTIPLQRSSGGATFRAGISHLMVEWMQWASANLLK